MLKVHQRDVEKLEAQPQAVFRAMKTQWQQAKHILAELHLTGHSWSLQQVECNLHKLERMGFAQVTDGGNWRRAAIRENGFRQEPLESIIKRRGEEWARSQRDEQAVPAPGALPAIGDETIEQLLAFATKDLEDAKESYDHIVSISLPLIKARVDDSIERLTELATRPSNGPNDAELAELRDKAQRWDELQRLMGPRS